MRKLILIIAIAIFLTSCEDSVESPISDNSNAKPLMPLELNNQWVYEDHLDNEPIVYCVDSVFTYTHQDSQIEMFSIRYRLGKGIYEHLFYYYGGSLNRTLPWRIEPDGPEYCFKYPVETGNQWTNEYHFLGYYYYIDEYTLVSKNARVFRVRLNGTDLLLS